MPKSTKDSDTKKVVKKKTTTKKGTSVKATTKSTKKASTAKPSEKKVASRKKETAKPADKKTTRSTTSKKSGSTQKTITAKKKTTKKVSKTHEIIEYYDLPYRYNQTIVKLLAQTPNTLFVYWDISDEDRKNYIKQFGENFFNNTIPVLIIHNTTMNYSFEIEVNDFANCWYFNVNDANCEYTIELGRRPKNAEITLNNNYLHISHSNKIDAPNDHILFEKNQKVLFFRNVKTNQTFTKDSAQFEFMSYAGKSHPAFNIYKKIYTREELNSINNPSSSFNGGAF